MRGLIIDDAYTTGEHTVFVWRNAHRATQWRSTPMSLGIRTCPSLSPHRAWRGSFRHTQIIRQLATPAPRAEPSTTSVLSAIVSLDGILPKQAFLMAVVAVPASTGAFVFFSVPPRYCALAHCARASAVSAPCARGLDDYYKQDRACVCKSAR